MFAYQIRLSVRVRSKLFTAVVTVKFSDEDEGQENDDDQDDRDGDTNQDGGVVRVSGNGLGPRGLTELVHCCVGSDLTN